MCLTSTETIRLIRDGEGGGGREETDRREREFLRLSTKIGKNDLLRLFTKIGENDLLGLSTETDEKRNLLGLSTETGENETL